VSHPRLLFASYHAYLDHSSGAALATRDLFEDLAAHGWDCRVVCGPRLDYEDGRGPAAVLRELGVPYHLEQCAPRGGAPHDLFHFTLGGVPVTQFRPHGDDPRRPPTRAEGVPFLDVAERACARHGPDVGLTYGGHPVGPHLIRRVRRRGARVVFTLHNTAYADPALFREADAFWVPSEFGRRVYRERAGIEAEVVPWPWDHARVLAGGTGGRFVTFVNPQPAKGAAWFARIALELARRPDIGFLVVEGRGGADGLRRLPVDLSGLTTVRGMRSTPQPRRFYGLSRMVLVPSVCEDMYPRVACEALANGLPVLASRRGGLPELLGDAGFVFDIPDRYTTRMLAVPSAEEVAPWVTAIERLYDDEGFHQEHRRRALERAAVWEPDRLRPGVVAFFRRVANGDVNQPICSGVAVR
jgi:glycosyltransferase involved in cell wall biosynthesis